MEYRIILDKKLKCCSKIDFGQNLTYKLVKKYLSYIFTPKRARHKYSIFFNLQLS